MRQILFILTLAASGLLHRASAQLYSLTSTDFFIYFESDSYEVTAVQKRLLTNKILEIGGTNIKEIYVEGHTDSFATSEYNAVLATNRALAAVKVLESIGVPSRFIKMESFGESALVSEVHRQNRRAKVYFIYETDYKSELSPPKWVIVKTIDKKTKKPIKASISFDYEGQEMKFSMVDKTGVSAPLSLLSDEVTISASAMQYLSAYLTIPKGDIDKPIDTLIYVLELSKVRVTDKLTYQHIYFFTDSDEMRPESQPELVKLLAALQRNKDAYVEIQGHMNYPINRPTNSMQQRWNMELSYKRAKAIYHYLVTSGVSRERLTYKGMSNFRMKFKLPANRAEEDQNKRVEIYLLKQI
ncbi:OmpA family protein [Bacteroidia bacterium]|nr:OmpA family protein [Bacteroidia bacterium]